MCSKWIFNYIPTHEEHQPITDSKNEQADLNQSSGMWLNFKSSYEVNNYEPIWLNFYSIGYLDIKILPANQLPMN